LGSIAGLASREGENVSGKVVEMLNILRHRGPDFAGIACNGDVLVGEDLGNFDASKMRSRVAVGSNKLKLNGNLYSDGPVIGCSEGFVAVFDGDLYNFESLKTTLEKEGHRFSSRSHGEVIVHLFEDLFHGNFFAAVKGIIRRLYGVYAFAVAYGDKVVFARDSMGVRPLFFGDGNNLLGFASERKALWKIGIKNVYPLKPGYVGFFEPNYGKVKVSQGRLMKRPSIKYFELNDSVELLRQSLSRAFKLRACGPRSVGVLFSGGLDSTIVAYLLRELGLDVSLYVGGVEGSFDILNAESVAKELDLEIHVHAVDKNIFENYLHKVVYAIEETDVMKTSVAFPIFLASEKAHENGLKVVYSGQGADELFGGYNKYLGVLQKAGYSGLQNSLWNDVKNIANNCLQSCDAGSYANCVELHSPFVEDVQFILDSMKISPKLKISSVKDGLRKLVLRKTAEKLGLPKALSNTRKRAAQYSSGAEKTIIGIAKMKGHRNPHEYLDKIFYEEYGFKPNKN
jgi:asparagine synthase (glutamine-hydrolysing)